jgi:hypothetical protein
MLSSSVETYHLDQFKLVLYHLEAFDIEEVEWKIDQVNTLRSKDETGKLNTVVSWGELGYIDDWFLERVEIKAGNWSPSLSTTRSNYGKRKKPIASLYSIGHRRNERTISRPRGPRLPKRRRLSSVNPWTGFIKSYLENRRGIRTLEGPRYDPTDQDVEKILLAAAPFVQTRKRQAEEACWSGPVIHRIVY